VAYFFFPTFSHLYGLFLAFCPWGCACPLAQTQEFNFFTIRDVLTYVEMLGPTMTVAGEILPQAAILSL